MFKLAPTATLWLSRASKWLKRTCDHDIRHRTRLVDAEHLTERFSQALALLQENGEEIGDYLEFGVYDGTSLSCMYRAMKPYENAGNTPPRFFGFDSFEGLPAIASSDSGGHWRPGDFKSSLEFTRRVLRYEGVDLSRVTLVKGYFDDTLTDQRRVDLQIRKASVIMVDCDLYHSTRMALRFCGPAILDQSVIFFDDWYPLADRDLGEKKAMAEWLAADATLRARELFDFPPYGKAFLVTRG